MSKSEDERAKRLAEALRLNLRRRKAQARGEVADKTAEPDSPPHASGESANEG